ncbi:MAG: PQQ-like beta-propeller repeat protein [Verrucomicrobia bacterium]|nr:PQQ-like beta-propeller repeat protein [Verrucomicrobiota bacterium]
MMNPTAWNRLVPWMPLLTGAAAILGLGVWFALAPGKPLAPRVPGTDRTPGAAGGGASTNAVLAGQWLKGPGEPAEGPGTWPEFRGPNRDGISPETLPLAKSWGASGPREVWGLDVGEGYAGAAVTAGRVYLMDYDREKKQDALRCLSRGDGREIWRYAYPVAIKRNHGMSRTMPTVAGNHVVGIGPKCHVLCLDAGTGDRKWGLDMVHQYGATVPPWYAGQCPLVEGGQVILAPGGPEALLVALDLATGTERWRTPNPKGWKMTHASVVSCEMEGQRMFVYCASHGVVAVSATDGTLLWETPDWKISIATVPSPVPIGGGRLFFSGGYNAGSLMLQVTKDGNRFIPKTLFRLEADVFGATQQTPVFSDNHVFGVRPNGEFVCLDTAGKIVWTSGGDHKFGLGPFLKADGVFYVMNDHGMLSMIEATPARFAMLGRAKVLQGRESWGPLSLAGGRLWARDLTRLVCLDVAAR